LKTHHESISTWQCADASYQDRTPAYVTRALSLVCISTKNLHGFN